MINGGKILVICDEASKILASYFCNLLINSPDDYPAFPVIDLSCQSPFCGNILTYSSSISREIETLTQAQDILIAFYFGPIPENIIFSLEETRLKGAFSLGFLNKNNDNLWKSWNNAFMLNCPNFFMFIDSFLAFITIFIQLLNYYIFEDPAQLATS